MKSSRLQVLTCLAVSGMALVLTSPCALGNDSEPRGAADPTSTSGTQRAMEVAYDYTALYEELSGSIVKVEVDSGSGSGFVVDPRGLIATNYHVVQNTRFLAVQFPDSVLARAEIVKLSARYDLAILKVHPRFVEGVPPLKLLLPEKENNIKAGLPVVAFGSPLSQTFLATQGIVSKVEEVALLGDFLLEPGNSGGPLVNLEGGVIGVNTFGLQGIAGAVRVSYLRKLLDGLDPDQLAEVEVSDQPLRTLSLKRYPKWSLSPAAGRVAGVCLLQENESQAADGTDAKALSSYRLIVRPRSRATFVDRAFRPGQRGQSGHQRPFVTDSAVPGPCQSTADGLLTRLGSQNCHWISTRNLFR
ncbi:MAG: hypothetical protein F4X19_12330, partial [Acidobacteria bacterium]|nr:hypothetical protein [Acidobacteriota bacterium]